MVFLIAAISDNNIIGVQNKLPWKLKNDLRWFKLHTLYGAVIMGRKTWLSLPKKPLVNRLNIICSRNCTEKIEGNVVWVSSFERALKKAKFYSRHTYIIGGGEIFHLALANLVVDTLILTRVHKNIEQKNSDKLIDLTLPTTKQLIYRSVDQIENKIKYHFEMYNLKI